MYVSNCYKTFVIFRLCHIQGATEKKFEKIGPFKINIYILMAKRAVPDNTNIKLARNKKTFVKVLI